MGYKSAIYVIVFVLGIFIFINVIPYCGFLNTNVDSARSLISTIIQSEAVILALVITLSLVAVQLAASSYSSRLLEIFRKSPDLWILTISYIASITYGLTY